MMMPTCRGSGEGERRFNEKLSHFGVGAGQGGCGKVRDAVPVRRDV